MEKCRLCLKNKKNLRSIYDTQDSYTYAFKITSISNVKIVKDDDITDKICMSCRKQLNEAFDFKLMIERSDEALQYTANCKRILFDNLDDIKIKIEITRYDKYVPKCEPNIDGYFQNGEDSLSYKGTTIKKVDPCETTIKNEYGPLSVVDFLNNIKEESENEFDDACMDNDYIPMSDDDYDEEYLLPLSVRREQYKKKKKAKKKQGTAPVKTTRRPNYNYKDKLKTIPNPIKPVYISDIRLIPTKSSSSKEIKTKKVCKNKNKKTEVCYYCGKITTTLKYHLLTHIGDRKFKCDDCGKGFLTKSSLQSHAKKHVEAKKKDMKCELCVACFGSKEALRSHMVSHSEERKFVCNVCNKGFKRKCAMKRHQLMHNVTNKNVKCELCNMSFFSKYGLNHHMRVHTGERPYNCELCSQPYSYKHDFNRHCLKKHGVFLKRRSVTVMNEEVLKREQGVMRDLMLKLHGFVNEGEELNPFEGPQGAQAFELAMKALKAKQVPINFDIQI